MADDSDYAYHPPGGKAYGPIDDNKRYSDELAIEAGRNRGFINSINKRLGGTNPGEVTEDPIEGQGG